MLANDINAPIRRCSGVIGWRKDLPPIPDLMDGVATRFDLKPNHSLSLHIYKEEEKKKEREEGLCVTPVIRRTDLAYHHCYAA